MNRGIGKSGKSKGQEKFTPSPPPPPHLLMYKHLGLYSYRRDALLNLAKMEPVELEKIEKLEQLRALVNGLKIKVKETF